VAINEDTIAAAQDCMTARLTMADIGLIFVDLITNKYIGNAILVPGGISRWGVAAAVSWTPFDPLLIGPISYEHELPPVTLACDN
jgi:hypothetical protein